MKKLNLSVLSKLSNTFASLRYFGEVKMNKKARAANEVLAKAIADHGGKVAEVGAPCPYKVVKKANTYTVSIGAKLNYKRKVEAMTKWRPNITQSSVTSACSPSSVNCCGSRMTSVKSILGHTKFPSPRRQHTTEMELLSQKKILGNGCRLRTTILSVVSKIIFPWSPTLMETSSIAKTKRAM